MHAQATAKPTDLGAHRLALSAPFEVRLVAVRKTARGRKGHTNANRRGVHPGSSSYKKYQRRGREPWILATSLDMPPADIVGIYGERMKIEETFRDAKSHRFGWSFADARCRKLVGGDTPARRARNNAGSKRLEVLLFLAALGMLVAHTVGKAAEHTGQRRRYQANTITHRRVLSLFFLGCQVLMDTHPPSLPIDALRAATTALRNAIEHAWNPSPERVRAICGDP